MAIKVSDVAGFFEKYAPSYMAEEWDNVGLLAGNASRVVKRIITCLDVTKEVVDEAVNKKADLIVSHHPLIFKGLKRIDEDELKGGIIHKIIKNDISVYSAHTNLDAAIGGVNDLLAERLDLIETKTLIQTGSEKLYKIVVFVPEDSLDIVRDAMGGAGAGWIGKYSDCSFSVKGKGTFKPLEGTNPYIGSYGNLEKVDEYRVETIVTENALKKTIDEMIKSHPYEEVAYDIYPLVLNGRGYGFGKVGALKKPCGLNEYIKVIKTALEVNQVRLIGGFDGIIRKVAVFSGSFDGNLLAEVKAQADLLVSGDIKYHTALDIAQMGMCAVDAGHFNTEWLIVSKITGQLTERFEGIDVLCNTVEKDPITFA